jgi:conserved hypothetical protein, YfiH family
VFYFDAMEQQGVRFSILARYPQVRQVVTESGRSDGSRPGFDLHFGSGCTDAAVVAHRAEVSAYLGTTLARSVYMQQRHGDRLHLVTEADLGRGTTTPENALEATDGQFTQLRQVALYAMSADCQGALFYDPKHEAIGAVHCGWKGTIKDILPKSVAFMQDHFDTRPDELLVGLGPSISRFAFEIREDVASVFRQAQPQIQLLAHPEAGKWYVDLPLANMAALVRAGVQFQHIERMQSCTYQGWPRYFSARRGDAGRFAVGIALQ